MPVDTFSSATLRMLVCVRVNVFGCRCAAVGSVLLATRAKSSACTPAPTDADRSFVNRSTVCNMNVPVCVCVLCLCVCVCCVCVFVCLRVCITHERETYSGFL